MAQLSGPVVRSVDGNTFTTTIPVAIDLRVEQAKLDSLRDRFVQSQATANQAVAQCIAVHVE